MDIRNANETLKRIKQCAVDTGIYHAWFLSFGTLLGFVRPTKRMLGPDSIKVRGIMAHDDDMDIGIMSHLISEQQEKDYVNLLADRGLFKKRNEHVYRTDNNRHAWMSLRPSEAPTGTKCCHWFWFRHRDWYWHSKGSRWIRVDKFPQHKYAYSLSSEALALGLPAQHFEHFVEIPNEDGEMYRVPMAYGSALDYWYPGWLTPIDRGTSARKIMLEIPTWKKEETWKIVPQRKRR